MSTADDQLVAFVDRILRMKEEKKALSDDIRAVYAEAAVAGYDKTTLGLIVRRAWQEGQGCSIYFAAFRRARLLKIGISRNIERRLRQLAIEVGEPAELVNSFPGIYAIEGWTHANFDQWREHGEWFYLNPDSEAAARRATNPLLATPSVPGPAALDSYEAAAPSSDESAAPITGADKSGEASASPAPAKRIPLADLPDGADPRCLKPHICGRTSHIKLCQTCRVAAGIEQSSETA